MKSNRIKAIIAATLTTATLLATSVSADFTRPITPENVNELFTETVGPQNVNIIPVTSTGNHYDETVNPVIVGFGNQQ